MCNGLCQCTLACPCCGYNAAGHHEYENGVQGLRGRSIRDFRRRFNPAELRDSTVPVIRTRSLGYW